MGRVVLVLPLLCLSAFAQDRQTHAGVDRYIDAQMQRYGIPGLSLAVVKNGTVLHLKGYGRANVEFDVPMSADTVSQIYSVTKIFAGIATMTLVEDGKLTLESPVTDHITEAPPAWKGIRIRHLLTHTSGLPELSDNPRYGAMTQEQRDALTNVDMVKLAAESRLRSEPGATWSYHRFAYTLLGLVVERVSGMTFDAFLNERIFRRVGMTSSGFGDVEAVIARRAPAYLRSGNTLRLNLYRFGFGNPGAGLNSSASDLAKLMALLDTHKLLKSSSLEAMWTPVSLADGKTEPYGLGWTVEMRDGRKVVGHEGGSSAWLVHYPVEHLSVVVLHNLNGSKADEIPYGVADIHLKGR